MREAEKKAMHEAIALATDWTKRPVENVMADKKISGSNLPWINPQGRRFERIPNYSENVLEYHKLEDRLPKSCRLESDWEFNDSHYTALIIIDLVVGPTAYGVGQTRLEAKVKALAEYLEIGGKLEE